MSRRSYVTAVVVVVLAVACTAQADPRVVTAERAAARFHELFNDEPGSIPSELMALDDAATIEWTNWLKRQRLILGRAYETRILGSEIIREGALATVEMRYATRFASGSARELLVARVEGATAKVAYWAFWWP